MMRMSLAARLALLFALLSFAVLAAVGTALYKSLENQLIERDDAGLVSRTNQIRTQLQDIDLIALIRERPQLFANMLSNRDALLILRFPGQPPLIAINPRHVTIPDILPGPAHEPLTLADIHHARAGKGLPLSVAAAVTQVSGSQQELHIIVGRLMMDRKRVLQRYRNEIVAVAAAGALLLSLCAWWAANRVLQPLHRLAQQTEVIGSRNLAVRIDERSAPRELHTLISGFNSMLDRLERSFTQLSQVSADMAHDLRTPIHNLLGQTEVALGQRRDVAFYERLLGSNFEELQRLSTMTDNMLFLARADHADHLIARQVLPAEVELKRIADYFEGLAAERDLQLNVCATGTVWADPMLLRRALANLIANAVRHAQAGSVIQLAAGLDGNGISISVENAGATIAPQHLERLFDRFYRADPAREDSSSSSGLGLSIVRSIMTLHQGQWQVASAAGVTRFSLWFPAAGG